MTMKTYPKKSTPRPKEKKALKKHPEGSSFEVIYDLVRQVPKGRITTYGAIAEATGMRTGARMVGWALNMCAGIKPKVPAHRVVNRLGILSGRHHFATPKLMEELLEQEGVKIKNDTVVDFKKLFWDPKEVGFF